METEIVTKKSFDGFNLRTVNSSSVYAANGTMVFLIGPGTYSVKKSFLMVPILFNAVIAVASQIGLRNYLQRCSQINVTKDGKNICNNQDPELSQSLYYKKFISNKDKIKTDQVSQLQYDFQQQLFAASAVGDTAFYCYRLDHLLPFCFDPDQETFNVQTSMQIELKMKNDNTIAGVVAATGAINVTTLYQPTLWNLQLRMLQNIRIPDTIQSHFFLQKNVTNSVVYNKDFTPGQLSKYQIIGIAADIVNNNPSLFFPEYGPTGIYLQKIDINGTNLVDANSLWQAISQMKMIDPFINDLQQSSILDYEIQDKKLSITVQTTANINILIGIQYYE